MSALPAPLKPWASQLSLLQRELALAIAPLVQRLSLAIGPLADAQSQPTGAPDGADGVTRRGSYERLLATEWLYADEAPEEFLRRAAEGEHLFTKLAVREPHHARQCFVAFDAGPEQLGAPRVAHLAAFIAFAARCEAAHADLHWAVLQHTTAHARAGATREEVEQLLKARHTREATDADVARWLAALDARQADVWFVGGPSLLRLPAAQGSQLVTVDEATQPEARRLDVAVHRGGRARRAVQLSLPPSTTCVSLLRSPFPVEPPKPAPRASRPTRGLTFSASGNRLFTRGQNGELITVVLPHGTGASVKQVVFQPPPMERVIAGGWHKGLLALTARHDHSGRVLRLALYSLTKRGEKRDETQLFEVPEPVSLPLPADTFTDVCVLSHHGKRKLYVVLLGRCFSLDDGRLIELRDRVLAHTQRSERMLLLVVDAEGRRTVRTLFANGTQTTTHLEGLGPTRASFAGGTRYPLPLIGLGEMVTSPRWTLIDHTRSSFGLDVPEGGTVLGVTPPSTWVAGLLVRTADMKRLLHVSAQGTQTVVDTEAPIVELATDYEFPRAAWLDASGGIGVFDASNPHKLLIGLPDGNGRRQVHFTEYRR